jgi:hypothetical protein
MSITTTKMRQQQQQQSPLPTKDDEDNQAETEVDEDDDDDAYLATWLRRDCYSLYKTLIFPQSTPVKKRAGMLRFSMNVAYNVKKHYRPGAQQRNGGGGGVGAQFLEFGVAAGKDMVRIVAFLSHKEQHLALCDKTTVHGFDSFHGLPEVWDNGQVHDETGESLFPLGHFSAGGQAPLLDALQQNMRVCRHGVHDNQDGSSNQCPVEFHAGWFQDTVPAFFANQQEQHAATTTMMAPPIAFVHADADLYSSTLTFLKEICARQLFVVGSVITFDEYANYENWQDGEYKAWMEICACYKIQFRYLCHHAPPRRKHATTEKNFTSSAYGYQSVSVIITGVGSDGTGE